MSIEDAKDRLIDPENIVMGGKTSSQMYEFVPSEETQTIGDFVEEKDYFTRYSEMKSKIPFDLVPEGIYEFPEKMEAFIYPHGVFDHFVAPRRLYGNFFFTT